MKLMIYEPAAHRLEIGDHVIFPDAVSVFRRDTCNEISEVGGGIRLRTNGSRGVELLVTGRYAPDEKKKLQKIIEGFALDEDSVAVDGRDYGKMIMLESALIEKAGDIGGSFRFRLGGLELEYDGGNSYAL